MPVVRTAKKKRPSNERSRRSTASQACWSEIVMLDKVDLLEGVGYPFLAVEVGPQPTASPRPAAAAVAAGDCVAAERGGFCLRNSAGSWGGEGMQGVPKFLRFQSPPSTTGPK